jgi:hypothetical protein
MQPPKIDLTGKRALVTGRTPALRQHRTNPGGAGARVAINYVVKRSWLRAWPRKSTPPAGSSAP